MYFDDVTVTLGQGLQVQENSYDPYGLSLAGLDYASPGIKGLNYYQFNSKEKQYELGLGWFDYGARVYNPQLGVWHGIDPLSEKMRGYSPYNYAFDNPLRFTDPDGKGPHDILKNFVQNVKDRAIQYAVNRSSCGVSERCGYRNQIKSE